MAYETTEVDVSKSHEQIRLALRRRGASGFQFGEQEAYGVRYATVEFVAENVLVRLRVPFKLPDEEWLEDKVQRARKRTRTDIINDHLEQEDKRIWRVLYWTVKVRMEAIEEGVETFHQAWLPHIVDPKTNRTIWESVRPAIEHGALSHGGEGLPMLTAGEE